MPRLFCSTCWDRNRSTPLPLPAPPQNHQTTNQEGSANATAKQDDSNRALFPSLAAVGHVAPPTASKDVNDNYSQPPQYGPLPPRVISRYEGTSGSPLGADQQQQQQQQLSTDSRRRCPSCGIVLLRKNLARHLRDQHQSANQPRQVRGLYCRVTSLPCPKRVNFFHLHGCPVVDLTPDPYCHCVSGTKSTRAKLHGKYSFFCWYI